MASRRAELSNRCSEGTFNRPPVCVYTHSNSGLVNPSFSSPIAKVHGNAIIRQQPRTTTVFSLLAWRCPANIAGFIVSIIVDAIQAVAFCRGTPYMSQEGRERVFPLLTHRNATTTISAVKGVVPVRASLNHARPSMVFLGNAGCAIAMLLWFSCCSAGAFPLKTTTTSGMAVTKMPSGSLNDGSTIAPTDPPFSQTGWSVLRPLAGVLDNEPSIASASEIQERVVSHFVTFRKHCDSPYEMRKSQVKATCWELPYPQFYYTRRA